MATIERKENSIYGYMMDKEFEYKMNRDFVAVSVWWPWYPRWHNLFA